MKAVRKAIPKAPKTYCLLDAEKNLQVPYPDCGHDFSPAVRVEAYKFIDRVLQHKPHEARASTTGDTSPPCGTLKR